VTLFVPRVLSIVALFLGGCTIIKLATIGATFDEKRPLTGWRVNIVNATVKFGCKLLLIFAGLPSTLKTMDYDYSYYLGPDFKKKQVLPKHVPTYFGNHPSALDALSFLSLTPAAPAARGSV
jgi:hypothetical protein